MQNVAGMKDPDPILEEELNVAGIPIEKLPECLRNNGEVHYTVCGSLYRWVFTRNWYYWVARGPGIPIEAATELYNGFGTVVRMEGDAGILNPSERYNGLGSGHYHIDTGDGLKALADTIKKVVADFKIKQTIEVN